MRILVAIANYGTKNARYAKNLIQEFQSMPFDVTIFLLSERPKSYGDDVTVMVGLPTKDPWFVPFAHRRLFQEKVDEYDLFIYSEDDTLIQTSNVIAFLNATERLGENLIPGFVRYELDSDGRKSYPEVHGPYHWVPSSVKRMGEYAFARFTNEHSACYMLTQKQLRRAIASGGYALDPHQGRYDFMCSGGNDPYTQCGFTRVVCFSHLRDFELHHLSDAYVNRGGLDEHRFGIEIEALSEILNQQRSDEELCNTEKSNFPVTKWDKDYHEPCRDDILRFVPKGVRDVLSVGCGWGATEAYLLGQGNRVTAIPLDSVIGKLAEARGISMLPPNLARALEIIDGHKFDAIILSEVLQHLQYPEDVLVRLGACLRGGGLLVGSVPNLSVFRRLSGRLLRRQWACLSGGFDKTNLNLTTRSKMKRWLNKGKYSRAEAQYGDSTNGAKQSLTASVLPGTISASSITFAGERANS
jgi:hypothetical protein